MFEPMKNEKRDNVIEMSKDHISFVQSSDNDEDEMRISKTEQTVAITSASSNIPSGDSSLTKSYLMWQNNANVCWLDASMALLVHNRTLMQSVSESSKTQVANILQHYYKAVSVLNDYADSKLIDERVKDAKDMLKSVQESTLKYLQPILKYKEGEPDSAFCSLLNLIVEDKSVKDFFELEYTWVQVCQECKTHRAKKHRKSIITLPRVKGFQPSSPISLYQCLVCKASDQRMTLSFRTLPQCLLFHFESGAGKGELQCSSFKVDERTYKMTGVMTLEKGRESNSNHFVTFIRDPPSDMWMECNDLCEDITCFNVVPPFIDLQDVYILMFEAMDGNGTLPNRSLATEKYVLEEELASESVAIPFIDLEDEAEDKAEAGIKEGRQFEESKNLSGKVDLSGKDCKEGSGEDVLENVCGDVFCANAKSLGKDPGNISSNGNIEDVSLFGTDCEDDSTKDQYENVQLLKAVCGDESTKDKFKVEGLFGKFHLACKDNSSQEFSEVYHGGSMYAAEDDVTMSVGKPLSESKDALLNEITSTYAVNPSANAPSQLQVNNMENTSLQSGSRQISAASVFLNKDIFTSKNDLESVDDMAHSPKDNAGKAFIDTSRTDFSDNSIISKGERKKLFEKEKPVSHHQKTLLGSEKTINETLENVLVPERSESQASGMQSDKIDTSLEVEYRNTSKTLTEIKSEIPLARQSKARKSFFRSRKCKLEDSSYPLLDRAKQGSHFSKVESVNSKISKGVRKKLVEKDKPVSHHQKTLLGSEKTINETLENVLVPERSESQASGMQPDKIDTSLEVEYRNNSKTLTEIKSEIPLARQSKARKSFFRSRKCKLEDSSYPLLDRAKEGSHFSKVESVNSKISEGVRKKLVEKDKPVSHHQKTLLGSEKTINETENFLVSERSENQASGMQPDKIDTSLEVAYRNASKTLTEIQSEIPFARQSKARKSVFKSRKRKLEDSSKVENNSSKMDDNLNHQAVNKSNITPETTSESLQNLGVNKKKKYGDQIGKKDLKTSNKRSRKQLIAKESNAKTFLKNRKHKLVEIDDDLHDHPLKTSSKAFKTSESSLQNQGIIKKNKIGEHTMARNFKTYSNCSNKQVTAKQRKAQTFLKNRTHKSIDSSIVEGSSLKHDNDLQEHSIIISDVKTIVENASELKNLDVIEEQLQIQSDSSSNNLNMPIQLGEMYASTSLSFSENENFENSNQNKQPQKTGLIYSSDPFAITLIAKENKAKTLLQNRNLKLLNRLKDKKNSTKTNVALQEIGIDSVSTETTNEGVNSLQTADAMGKNKIGKKPQSKRNVQSVNLNLSNDLSNMPLPAKQSEAKYFSKNRKRNCADSLKSEVSAKIDNIVQDNIPLNISLDKSPNDIPLKNARYQLRNIKPASQQQNGTEHSKVNEPLPSSYDKKIESLHGPSCLCDGTKMTEDLIDMIIGSVLKGFFSFIGIKQKK